MSIKRATNLIGVFSTMLQKPSSGAAPDSTATAASATNEGSQIENKQEEGPAGADDGKKPGRRGTGSDNIQFHVALGFVLSPPPTSDDM